MNCPKSPDPWSCTPSDDAAAVVAAAAAVVDAGGASEPEQRDTFKLAVNFLTATVRTVL